MAEHDDTPIDAADGSREAAPTALAGSRVRALASSDAGPSASVVAPDNDDDLFTDWSAEELARLDLGLDALGMDGAMDDSAHFGEGNDDAESLDADALLRVRARLDDYQRLLGHAQAALLDVELPGGPGSLFERIESSARLPAGGLVESGQHIASPSPVASLDDARERRSGSLRQAIVPLLAVAAGVALIFMLAQGQQGPRHAQEEVARRADKEAPASAPVSEGDAKLMGDAEPSEADNDLVATRTADEPAPAAGALAKDNALPADGMAEAMMEEQEFSAQAGRGAASGAPVPAKPSAKSAGGSAGYSDPAKRKEAKPAPEEAATSKSASADKNDQWSELDGVHALRRKGRCGLAIDQYEAIIASNPVNLVRARAEAGLALCLESAGRASDAKTHFALAKQLDPSIGTFIDRERDKMPMNDEKSPSKAKKADALEDLP